MSKNFYGIDGIGFVWNGDQSDPTLTYKGREYALYYALEDSLWQDFVEDNGLSVSSGEDDPDTLDAFGLYVHSRRDDVVGLLEDLIAAQ